MNKSRLSSSFAIISILSLGVFLFILETNFSRLAQARQEEIVLINRQLRFILEPLSQNLGGRGQSDPGKRRASGSRNDCPSNNGISLTAIVPQTLKSDGIKEHIFGKTISTSPRFWFYNPYELTSDFRIKLVIRDEQGNEVYTTGKSSIAKTQPGIISFHDPNMKLESGKNYHWHFYVYCHPSDSAENLVVHGWINRMSLNSKQLSELNPQMTSLKQAIFYAQMGAWFDAISILGEQLTANPQDKDFQAEWTNLLSDIGLTDLPSQNWQKLQLIEESE